MSASHVTFEFDRPAQAKLRVSVLNSDGTMLRQFTRDVAGKTPSDLAGLFKADVLAWTYYPFTVRAAWPAEISHASVWRAFRDAIAAVPRGGADEN